MKGQPIESVEPLDDGVLKITFDTGNRVTLDMKPKFKGFRFGVLENSAIWLSVDTDGGFVYWYKNGVPVAELAYNEIMQMILGESY